jgi:uncharacterized damage-inducible protein DinB
MVLPAAITLIDLFKNNHDIIHLQLKDISQAESLLQPPFQGNCMNWVIGHILTVHETCLSLLGLPGIMTDTEKAAYGYGSEPIVEPTRAGDLISMLERLDKSLKIIITKLGELTEAELDRQVQIWRGPLPLAEAIAFMLWHEAYHTGQLELLRQLAGKNDHVI